MAAKVADLQSWNEPVELPRGDKPLRNPLVADCGVGVLLERMEACVLPEHEHLQWQVAFFFGEAHCTAHWRGSAGQAISRELKGGDVWIVPPGTSHGLEWMVEDDLMVIYLHPSRAPHPDVRAGVMIAKLADLIASENLIGELCKELRPFCGQAVRYSPTRIGNIAALLAVVAMETAVALRRGEKIVADVTSRAAQVVERVKQHVGNVPWEELSVDRLARELGISPRHFRRLYRRAAGMTPQAYLWSRRIAFGKALLVGGDHNVTEAAHAAGFSDATHMNRHFRAVYGVAPSAFLPRGGPRQPE